MISKIEKKKPTVLSFILELHLFYYCNYISVSYSSLSLCVYFVSVWFQTLQENVLEKQVLIKAVGLSSVFMFLLLLITCT